ncbi:MAG: hypothetical protein HZB82_00780 [Deltaproteobacteria bacterium]|nr:hypothetical protein [Deltaproteobacteria bacterium]
MRETLWRLVPLYLLIFVSACAAPAYRVKFSEAVKAARYEDAYVILKDVCPKNQSESICLEMENVGKQVATGKFEKVKAGFEAMKRPAPLDMLEAVKKSLLEIKEISGRVDLSQVADSLQNEIDVAAAKADSALKEAEGLYVKKERKKAAGLFRAASEIDSRLGPRLADFTAKAVEDAYLDGVKAAEAENWEGARIAFEEALYIKPDYKDAADKAAEAKGRDTAEYYIKEAADADKGGNIDRALALYKYALKYGRSDEAAAALTGTRIKAANALFTRGVEMMQNEWPLSAGALFIKSVEMMGDIPEAQRAGVKTPAREISRLLNELYVKGKKEGEAGNAEAAYLYLRTVSRLQPEYPDINTVKERYKDEIRRRAMQTLAIIPFKGPSYNVDAGGAITSSVLDFLYTQLSRDVRILERGAIEAILKESEVKTFQSGEGAKGFLQLLGADHLLLGDVVNYKVDSNVFDTNKTVRAKTGTRNIRNPRYIEWEKKSKGDAPEEYIDEPVFEDIKYKLTHYAKTALVTVSYRIVDSKGDVINTGVAEKRVDAEDDAAEGVEIGEFKIAAKVSKIPSDTDLLRTAQTDVVEKIGSGLKKMFASPEQRLVKEADAQMKRSAYRPALEKAVDALFILERKGLDTAPAEEKINTIIKEGKF